MNVVPSPPVTPMGGYSLTQSEPLIFEVPNVRCRNLDKPMFTFTVAVGKKQSHASQYVDDAVDVADVLVKVAKGCAQSGRWSRANTEDQMFA